MSHNAGTLSITTSLTGGNFSGMNYTTSDSSSPVLSFDTLAIRVGGGSNQFSNYNFESFTVSQIPEPSTYAAFAGLAVLGLVAYRRRRAAAPAN